MYHLWTILSSQEYYHIMLNKLNRSKITSDMMIAQENIKFAIVEIPDYYQSVISHFNFQKVMTLSYFQKVLGEMCQILKIKYDDIKTLLHNPKDDYKNRLSYSFEDDEIMKDILLKKMSKKMFREKYALAE